MTRDESAKRDAEMVALYRDNDAVTMQDCANRYGISKARVSQIFERLGVQTKIREVRLIARPKLQRLRTHDANPTLAIDLPADHEAVVEARALFRNTVVGPWESPRFLISGKNSLKIGALVTKGPWAGMPVFTLTLEERATCPRSCHHWAGCYGNGMPLARRNDALHEDFIPALKAEVISLVREVCATNPLKPAYIPPPGLVIRLHVLGDFFSAAYVKLWGQLLKFLPELRVFGYTARRMDETPEDYAIASEIQTLNERYPDRWAIRTSHIEPGEGRTIVVRATPRQEDVILCPEQAGKTTSCSTCGLCWNRAAWSKTVAFLEHGQKRRERPSRAIEGKTARGRHAVPDAGGLTQVQRRMLDAMLRKADERGVLTISAIDLSRAADISTGSWGQVMKPLRDLRYVRVLRAATRAYSTTYQVFAEAQGEWPPAPALPVFAIRSRAAIPLSDGQRARPSAKPVVERKPDEPLVKRTHYVTKAKYHPRTGALLNPHVIGSADRFDIGTPEERVNGLAETEKERIARMYGATFKAKETA